MQKKEKKEEMNLTPDVKEDVKAEAKTEVKHEGASAKKVDFTKVKKEAKKRILFKNTKEPLEKSQKMRYNIVI